ncbi:MAG TPA: M48 family metalloprotease [Actinophytocola sp.]|uniref:M48 family metallopeptidase n=1 Tax=Actinophytocola sp. TaxID=1872138 RepID=UPI002DBC9114|nr:M48 family metalloprotease [Actinophytocola sp.]HEU5472072.1 M48 family metalloprotease [Actinophytocola sp.]
MGLGLRAAATVVLLLLFPTVMLALLAGLITVELLALRESTALAAKWAFVAVPVGLVLAKGLGTLVAKIHAPAEGVRLTEAAQPELWGLVRKLAVVAGTRPPDEIYLTAEVNAAVMEETRLLGLIAGTRRMFIGAPLLAGLREDQFAAVITHELAHYGNGDTRLTGMAYRGRRALLRTVSELDRSDFFQKLLAFLLIGYLKLYLRASTAVCRRQELAADQAAARAAGSPAASGALRELAPLDAAWDAFTEHHLLLGWQDGYLPADVFGGFADFRASVDDQLDRLRQNPPADGSPYDTHPPTGTRVTAIDALAAAPVVELDQRAGTVVLRDPKTVLDAALLTALVPEAAGKQRADWATLAALHGRAVTTAQAAATMEAAVVFARESPSVRTLLDTLDAGRLTDLAKPETPMPNDAGPQGRREFVRGKVIEGVTAAVQAVLVDAGVARWTPTWPSGAEFVIDEPYAGRIEPLVAAACADPADTAGLRALLAEAGADLDAELAPPARKEAVTR